MLVHCEKPSADMTHGGSVYDLQPPQIHKNMCIYTSCTACIYICVDVGTNELIMCIYMHMYSHLCPRINNSAPEQRKTVAYFKPLEAEGVGAGC